MNLKLMIFLSLISFNVLGAKRILMMIPDNFWWTEYSEPYEIYKKAGFEVITASQYDEKITPDKRNLRKIKAAKKIKADITFKDVKVEEYDAITFVAGNGAWHDFFPNQDVHNILLDAFKEKKIIGLLCASTGLLGMVGNWDGTGTTVAKGKKVTGYFRVEGILRKLGQVNFISGGKKDPYVVVDGNLVTGRNPYSSKIFGEKVVSMVRKK